LLCSDRATHRRINRLIDNVPRDPFEGIGKPEPLCHALVGSWSRRNSEQHRLVHLVDGDDIVILQVRYHHS
jgi:toxin YoeB